MSAELPAVSVVMPLFNKQDQVLASVSSVLAQSFTDWELIIVDDGSTDDSFAICADVADPRVRILRQKNAGVSAARNTGIRAARSELVAFLDADDLWLPEFLAAVTGLARDFPEAGILATSYRFEAEHGRSFDARLSDAALPARGVLHPYFAIAARSDPPVCSSAVAVRAKALAAIGGFPEGTASGEDLLTWARLAVNWPVARDSRVLAIYQTSSVMRPTDPANKVGRALEDLRRHHPEIEGLGAYLGYWYYIQTVLAVRAGQRLEALLYAWRSLRAAPQENRAWISLILALMPRAPASALQLFRQRNPQA